jgi:hypothetical protein
VAGADLRAEGKLASESRSVPVCHQSRGARAKTLARRHHALRHEHIPALLEELHALLETMKAHSLPKSATGKAV